MNNNSSQPLWRAIAIPTCLCIFGLLIALGVLEIGVRLITSSVTDQTASNDRPEFYYAHKDARTFQGPSYPPLKSKDEFRIAIVGDSFSFATAMQSDDAFPAKLGRLLSTAYPNQNIRVINYGVPGYSVQNNLESVRHALSEKADLVILQVTLNDPQKKQIRPTGLQFQNRFGPSKAKKSTAGLAAYWKTLGFVLDRLHNTTTTENYIKFYFDLFEAEASWDFFRKHVKLIKRHCRSTHTPFATVVFPLFGLPLDQKYPFHPIHQKVREFLTLKGIRHLDLFDVYEGIPLERIQVIPGVDFHPNEFGHRLAAEALFLWIHEQNLLPDRITRGGREFETDKRWQLVKRSPPAQKKERSAKLIEKSAK